MSLFITSTMVAVARRGESTDDYIARLETELEELREEVRLLRASRAWK